MIVRLIGVKRLTWFCVLQAINLLLAIFYFTNIMPLQDEANLKLSQTTTEIATLKNKLGLIREETDFVKKNLDRYETLKQGGFFAEQDRFMINRTLEDLRKKTTLSGFSFTVSDIQDIANPLVKKEDYKLLNSRISIGRIEAVLDTDIYSFLQEIPKAFPEHVRINSFSVKRDKEVTDEALRNIANGKSGSFVSAEIVFDWLTLASVKPADTKTDVMPVKAGTQ